MIKFLLWVGFVKWGRKSTVCDYDEATRLLVYRYPAQIIWPFHGTTWEHFRTHMRIGGPMFPRFYVFRNLPGLIKYRKGRLLPIRWGIGFCGIEFGDRG